MGRSGRADDGGARVGHLAGGVVVLAAGLFPVLESVVAAGWAPPGYDWSANYLSDLGVPQCVVTDRVICSPRHAVMNAGFVTLGLLVGAGAALLRSLVRTRWRGPVLVAAGVLALGVVGLGVFPGSVVEALDGDVVRMALHTTASVAAVVGGLVTILLVIVASWGRRAGYVGASAALLAVGCAGVAVDVLGLDVGLGPGAVQRLTVYPIVAWLVLTGVLVLVASWRGSLGIVAASDGVAMPAPGAGPGS